MARYGAMLEGLSGEAVDAAIEHVADEAGLIHSRRANEVVELAERFALFLATAPAVSRRASWDPEAGLASDRDAAPALPDVQAVRQRLFSSPDVPFTWAEAVTWIESEDVSGPTASAREAEAAALQMDRLSAELQAVAAVLHLRVRSLPAPVALPYVRPGEGWVVNESINQPFWPLADAVGSIAGRTRFTPALVTLWILAGIRPFRPRFTVEGIRRIPGPSSVRVEFHSPAVTREEVYALVKQARAMLAPRRAKATARDHEFIEMVRDIPGGVPDGEGALAFWTRVLAECRVRDSQPNYVGAGWRGPYNRWNRLVERGLVAPETEE